ncbi:MAG: hypothetical protein ACRDRA_00135 [Pseudonocardiaceae bacterium]
MSLTERGTAAAAQLSAERQHAAQSVFGDLPAAELATFVAVTDHVLDRIGASAATQTPRT